MKSSKQSMNELQKVEKDPNRLQEIIQSVREWQRKQPHLNFPLDDQLILSFLRCCKFSLERTKEKIDNYFTIKTIASDILCERDPSSFEIQTILNAGVILPLPNLDNDGCRIILSRYGSNLNIDTMHCSNIVKVLCMVLDILLVEDYNSVTYGIKVWAECKDCPLQYATQVTPSFLKKCTYLGDMCLPFRVKGIYTTNCPSILEFIFNIVKIFLSKKVVKRTFLYNESNFDEFYKKVPQHLLPSEYGGRNGSLQDLTNTWKNKVENYADWFIHNEKFKSNEELRQEKSVLNLLMFGSEGSFKKLDID